MHTLHFEGVLAADQLLFRACNGKLISPAFYIVNTDPSSLPGKHWVVFYINDNCCEFFDSLGQSPDFYHAYFKQILIKHSCNYMYTPTRLQNYSSNMCGKYCIYYVMQRTAAKTFKEIVSEFLPTQLDLNDQKLKRFFLLHESV